MIRAYLFLIALTIVVPAEAQSWRSGGPEGGRITHVVRAESDPQVWYATSRAGLFRSDDGGVTFRDRSAPFTDVAALAVDPTDENTLLVVRQTSQSAWWNPPPHLARTTDGGRTWRTLSNGFPTSFPFIRPVAILIDPRNPDLLLLGSRCEVDGWCAGGGLYRSTDGGDSWSRVPGPVWVRALARDPAAPDTLYVSDSVRGTLRSDDGGLTWRSSDMPLPSGEIVADPFNGARRYGVNGLPFVFISDDAGASWSGGEARLLSGLVIASWTDGSLEIDEKTGRIFLGTDRGGSGFSGGGLYRSGDGANRWLSIAGRGREAIHGMVFDARSGSITIATPTGLYRSMGFPYEEWQELPVGHRAQEVRRVVAHPRRAGTLYAIAWNHVYRSDDFGASWQVAAQPMPAGTDGAIPALDLAVDAGGDVYVLQSPGTRLLKLAAGSVEWTSFDVWPAMYVVADPNVPGTVYAGIRVTRDGGASWQTTPAPSGTRLTIDPSDGRRLFLSAFFGLYLSTDAGMTFSRILTDADLDVDLFEIIIASNVAISPADPNVMSFLARRDIDRRLVYRSVDGGKTWNTVDPVSSDGSSFDFVAEEDLLADVHDPQTLFAAIRTGVFRSDDGGATWRSIGEGLPAPSWPSLAMDRERRFLHLATSRGVWELPIEVPRRRSVRR